MHRHIYVSVSDIRCEINCKNISSQFDTLFLAPLGAQDLALWLCLSLIFVQSFFMQSLSSLLQQDDTLRHARYWGAAEI